MVWKKYCSMVEWLAGKFNALALVCLAAMLLPIVGDVLLRWTFGGSIHGVIEIEEALLMLLVFFSVATPQLRRNHIDVDLVFDKFPVPMQRGLFVFHWELAAILVGFIAWEVALTVAEKYSGGEFTPEIHLPTAPIYAADTAGLFLFFLSIIHSFGNAVGECVKNRNYVALTVSLALPLVVCALPWILEDTFLAWDYLKAGVIFFLALILLLFLRMPIGYAMCIVGLIGLMTIEEVHTIPLRMLGMSTPSSVMSYTLAVIPLFILMGELALVAGISTDLFDAASKWFGHILGGLAIASVSGCAGFAAICGDSLATAMTMSSVALPEMIKHKYNKGLACACLAAGGTLGILIPPSVGFIFYAIITEESLGKLFLGGVLPGLMLAAMFCAALYIVGRLHPELCPRGQKYTMREKVVSLCGVLPMMGLVTLVLGGILFGFFNPNEGGAVGAFGALVYAVLTRRINVPKIIMALQSTVQMTTKLMLILIGVNMLGYFFASSQLPTELADAVISMSSNKWLIFTLVVALYVALGCMLNVIPMILLTLPALYPTIQALGFDPIWFGVVTVILMEMGQITPPMGLVVFAIAGMSNVPMASIFKYVFIFVSCMMLSITVLAFFPQIVLFLPYTLLQ